MTEITIKRDHAEGNTEAEKETAIDLATRADQGDKEAMETLRNLAKDVPDVSSEIAKTNIRLQTIKRITNDSQLFSKWTVERDTEAMERQLAGPNPTPLEKMLAETAATCHLQWQISGAGGWGDYISDSAWKRTERCHRMLIQTLKTLAYVRKVPVGMLMVNMAEMQQVNVGKDSKRSNPSPS